MTPDILMEIQYDDRKLHLDNLTLANIKVNNHTITATTIENGTNILQSKEKQQVSLQIVSTLSLIPQKNEETKLLEQCSIECRSIKCSIKARNRNYNIDGNFCITDYTTQYNENKPDSTAFTLRNDGVVTITPLQNK